MTDKLAFLENQTGDIHEALQAILKLHHEKKLDGLVIVWREKDHYKDGTDQVRMFADLINLPITSITGMLSYAIHQLQHHMMEGTHE
jgi:hypothetical protein